MPTPIDKELYEQVKKKVKDRYNIKRSPFVSGAIVKEYKNQGGKYKNDKSENKLTRWFEEKWVDINPLLGIQNKSAYAFFRPTVKVSERTPELAQSVKKKFKNLVAEKQKVKYGNQIEDISPQIIVSKGKKGGALSSSNLKELLEASYNTKIVKVDGFIRDNDLSTDKVSVFFNPETKQTVVAHRGTSGFTDWFNNLAFAVGGDTGYKLTPRYKESLKIQKEAEKKYGSDNITTIGHSQGGKLSELVGGDSKEIITLNKATRPFSNNPQKNQYDISSSFDVISSFNPFAPKSGNDIIIPAENYNILNEHSINTLERLENDKMIGRGIRGGMLVKSTPYSSSF